LLLRRDWGVTYKPAGAAGDDAAAVEDPTAYVLAREAEKEELAAEDVRKLYVAATRHRDHLVFVGNDRRTRDGSFASGNSYLSQLDEQLGIADAVDAGCESIVYGHDHEIRVARLKPKRGKHGRSGRGLGPKAADAAGDGGQLAEALVDTSKKARPVRVLLASEAVGHVGGVAPTALSDFEHCPALYRWRHELRVPARAPGAGTARQLDAATAGTLFHRCMECIDFASDLPAQAGPLIHRVAAEMELEIDPAPLAAELTGMLETLAGSPLAGRIASADVRLPELSLLYDAGPATLSGQIDLLYRDTDGGWHVVDYKSDHIAADGAAERGDRYELQMMVYLAAARRQFGESVVDATLYFLRPGAAHTLAPGAKAFAAFEKRLADLAGNLIRCRATGEFPRTGDASTGRCAYCPYASLCGG